MAVLLSELGASVAIIGRNKTRLKEVQRKVQAASSDKNSKHTAIQADISDFRSVEKSFKQIENKTGSIDILINSAGIVRPGYFHSLPLNHYQEQMNTNYFGTLYSCRAVLPGMMERGKGHIANISSLAGLISIFGYTAYAPTKFAVTGLTKAMRQELKGRGISVSLLCPPDTDTPQLAEENLHKPYETKAIAGNAGMLSAESVAKDLAEGMAKNKFLILPGLESKIVYALSRFIPGISETVMDWQIRRSRK